MEELFRPKYCDSFICTADRCEDSCCRSGWEIPIDDHTYDFYKKNGISDIDDNICTGEEGDRIFRLRKDGSCPYLEDTGLCSLYKNTGGRLCQICANYPRFYEEYDGFTESGISVSCPEAQRLILTSDSGDYVITKEETSEDELLTLLHNAREAAFDFIADLDADMAALSLAAYGARLKELIDFDEPSELAYAAECVRGGVSENDEYLWLPDCIEFCDILLENTDILYDKWREQLLIRKRGVTAECIAKEEQKRAYLLYLTYRFFLKAINDCFDISAICRLAACAYFLVTSLPCGFETAIRLFSKEIEHDAENMLAVCNMLV